mmetsp:Transcript_167359/g.532037  ORF Transcript_167359/g.532037 Transcript_167359/m.532037 type:complete len:151 (-) Transcript_167359:253-705(-)
MRTIAAGSFDEEEDNEEDGEVAKESVASGLGSGRGPPLPALPAAPPQPPQQDSLAGQVEVLALGPHTGPPPGQRYSEAGRAVGPADGRCGVGLPRLRVRRPADRVLPGALGGFVLRDVHPEVHFEGVAPTGLTAQRCSSTQVLMQQFCIV